MSNTTSSQRRRTFAQKIAMELGKTPIQFDAPLPQPFYYFSNGAWIPTQPSPSTTPRTNKTSSKLTDASKIRLTTWNIDFQAPAAPQRMARALEYLSQLHSPSTTHNDGEYDDDIPSIIFLQEMIESDLKQIQETQWIQDRFSITDLSDGYWRGVYGTTTLVDRRLAVQRVFRVLFSMSNMQRDVLFVDVDVDVDGSSGDGKTIRFCNTHLESLTSNPPRRPVQLKLASEYMHGPGPAESTLPTPHASILAGDLNAFAPEDFTAPVTCNLTDAFLVLGGKDGTEESFTWGQQVPPSVREEFGCSRMDKVLFCGKVGVEGFRRVGEGVEIWVEYPNCGNDGEYEEEENDEDGESVWVTDHLGLQVILRVDSS